MACACKPMGLHVERKGAYAVLSGPGGETGRKSGGVFDDGIKSEMVQAMQVEMEEGRASGQCGGHRWYKAPWRWWRAAAEGRGFDFSAGVLYNQPEAEDLLHCSG